MAQLDGTTGADWTQALTLGPDEWEGIGVSVWNATVSGQFFDLGSDGHWQNGTWGEVQKFAPGQIQARRTGGCRFKTNPETPTTPGRVIVSAWKRGQSVIAGGVQLTGVLAATGAVTPAGAVTRGAVTLTFPGGSPFSDVFVVPHSLGVTPGAVVATVLTFSGTGSTTIIPTVAAFTYTASTFNLAVSYDGLGLVPPNTAIVVVAWIATA